MGEILEPYLYIVGFLYGGAANIRALILCGCGAVVYTVGCLAAFLPSTTTYQ